MANIAVILIILGFAAYQYFKGTLVKSVATLIITICSSVVAFTYFESLANLLISRDIFVSWSQTFSFILLFILAFAVLQTISGQVFRQKVDLGFLPERIGRVVCGIVSGLILSGLLLSAFAMAPLSTQYPYQRFDAVNPDAEKPAKVLFNADGFATGWFNIISSGSFSGKRSFGVLHPAFLDQVFLNRLKIADDIPLRTDSEAIEIPKKKAAWTAPGDLKDSTGRAISSKSGHSLTIVRIGIKKSALSDAGKFTLSQLRLVCNKKSNAKNPLVGTGKNVYPIGYLKAENQLKTKKLNDQIKIESGDFDGKVKWIDFAFYVPNGFVPVLAEFKQNNIAQVPPALTSEQAPPPSSFVPVSECTKTDAELQPVASAKIYGLELATGTKFLTGLKTDIKDPNHWQEAQTENSIKPAQFEDGQTSYVRAELRMEKPAQEEIKEVKPKATQQGATRRPRFRPPRKGTVAKARKAKGLPGMLKPLDDYKLLSLKCNNPPTGAAIKAEQLPVLVELSGLIHHPIGIVASGVLEDQLVCEIDYCSVAGEDVTESITIAEDGTVTTPFPDTIWLTEEVQSVSEFYVLYLVKSGRNAIITSVQPAGAKTAAGFKKYEGLLIK